MRIINKDPLGIVLIPLFIATASGAQDDHLAELKNDPDRCEEFMGRGVGMFIDGVKHSEQ